MKDPPCYEKSSDCLAYIEHTLDLSLFDNALLHEFEGRKDFGADSFLLCKQMANSA